MVVTGPEPEKVEDGRIVQLRHRGEPAEFPGVLHEGEITPDKGEDAGGELHRLGGKKANKNCSKNGQNKRRRRSAAYFFFYRSVVLSRSVRDMERGRRGDTLNNNVFNDRKQRAEVS